MESLEWRLHRIDHRIAERVILCRGFTDGVSLAGIVDTDGDGFIGHEGGSPL